MTPVKVDSEHINEEALNKADIVLNHYFIKTRKAYENRIKKLRIKNVVGIVQVGITWGLSNDFIT